MHPLLIVLLTTQKMQLDHVSGIYNYNINLHKTTLKNALCFENAIGSQKLPCTSSLLMVTEHCSSKANTLRKQKY